MATRTLLLAVLLAAPGASVAGSASPLVGHYRVEHYRILGEDTDARYPDLALGEDGVFRLGSATGTWRASEGMLWLHGYYDAWGPALVDQSARTLTFHFRRGRLDFLVVLHRLPDAPASTLLR